MEAGDKEWGLSACSVTHGTHAGPLQHATRTEVHMQPRVSSRLALSCHCQE